MRTDNNARTLIQNPSYLKFKEEWIELYADIWGRNIETDRPLVVSPFFGHYGLAGYVLAIQGSPIKGLAILDLCLKRLTLIDHYRRPIVIEYGGYYKVAKKRIHLIDLTINLLEEMQLSIDTGGYDEPASYYIFSGPKGQSGISTNGIMDYEAANPFKLNTASDALNATPSNLIDEKSDITWSMLVDLEPRLRDLLSNARAVKDDPSAPSFCANEIWYRKNGLRDQLCELVGWSARKKDSLLQSSDAYDLAYDKIYNALPDCRNCNEY